MGRVSLLGGPPTPFIKWRFGLALLGLRCMSMYISFSTSSESKFHLNLCTNFIILYKFKLIQIKLFKNLAMVDKWYGK